jgi:hypothetical protein
MDKFDRWKPYTYQNRSSKTIPFLRFKTFHTELNDMYWASRASVKAAYSATANCAKTASMSEAFHLNPQEYGYRELTLEKWSSTFTDFQNWTRLNALMSLSAYFEYYLQAITTLALESNPGSLLDDSVKVDGCIILKKRHEYSFLQETIPFVKGEWDSRKSAFVKTFGGCPQILEDNIGELDKMRNLRNNLGHTFGREVDVSELLDRAEFVPMQRLREERLKKWMGLVFQVADAIDRFLQERLIGSYDLVRMFHNWFKENSTRLPTKGHPNSIMAETVKRFQRYYYDGIVSHWGGVGLGRRYVESMICYYHSV